MAGIPTPDDFLRQFGRQTGIQVGQQPMVNALPAPPLQPQSVPTPMPIQPSPMQRPMPSSSPSSPSPSGLDPALLQGIFDMIQRGAGVVAPQGPPPMPQGPASVATPSKFQGVGGLLQGAQPATMGVADSQGNDVPISDEELNGEWQVYEYHPTGSADVISVAVPASRIAPPNATPVGPKFSGADKVARAVEAGKTIYQSAPEVQSAFLTPEQNTAMQNKGQKDNPNPTPSSADLQTGQPLGAYTDPNTGQQVVVNTATGAVVPMDTSKPITVDKTQEVGSFTDADGKPISVYPVSGQPAITPENEVKPDYVSGTSPIPAVTVSDLYSGNTERGIPANPELAIELSNAGISVVQYDEMVVRNPAGQLSVVPYDPNIQQEGPTPDTAIVADGRDGYKVVPRAKGQQVVVMYGSTPKTADRSFSDGMDVGDFFAAPAKFVFEGVNAVADLPRKSGTWVTAEMEQHPELQAAVSFGIDTFFAAMGVPGYRSKVTTEAVGGQSDADGSFGALNPIDDFHEWATSNPEDFQAALNGGYTAEDGTYFAPGNRAAWESFVGTKPWYVRAVYDMAVDPTFWAPLAGAGFGAVAGGLRGIEGVEGMTKTIPLWKQMVADYADNAKNVLEVPDTIVDEIVGQVVKPTAKAVGDGINFITRGKAGEVAGSLLTQNVRDRTMRAATAVQNRLDEVLNSAPISDTPLPPDGSIVPPTSSAPPQLPEGSTGQAVPPAGPVTPVTPPAGPVGPVTPHPDGPVGPQPVPVTPPTGPAGPSVSPVTPNPDQLVPTTPAGPIAPNTEIDKTPIPQRVEPPTAPTVEQGRLTEPTSEQLSDDLRRTTYPDGRVVVEQLNTQGTWEPLVRQSDAKPRNVTFDPYNRRLPTPGVAPEAPRVDPMADVLGTPIAPPPAPELPSWGFASPTERNAEIPDEVRNIVDQAWDAGQDRPDRWQQFVQTHDPKAQAFLERERIRKSDLHGVDRDIAEGINEAEYIINDLLPDYRAAYGDQAPSPKQALKRRPADGAPAAQRSFQGQDTQQLIERAIFDDRDSVSKKAMNVLETRARRNETKTGAVVRPQLYDLATERLPELRRQYQEELLRGASPGASLQPQIGQDVSSILPTTAPTPAAVTDAVPVPSTSADTSIGRIREIPLDQVFTTRERPGIMPGDAQMRRANYSQKTVDSIKAGIDPNRMEPIRVFPVSDNENIVLSGHSRLQGFREAGQPTIPARDFVGTPEEAIRFAEESNNLTDLPNPTETGRTIRRRVEDEGKTVKQAIGGMDVTDTQARQMMASTYLPEDIQARVDAGDLGLREARSMGEAMRDNVFSPSEMQRFYRESVLPGKMSAVKVERRVRSIRELKESANITPTALFGDADLGDTGVQSVLDQIDAMQAERRSLITKQRQYEGVAKGAAGLSKEQSRELGEINRDIARLDQMLREGPEKLAAAAPAPRGPAFGSGASWADEVPTEEIPADQAMRNAGAVGFDIFNPSLGIRQRTDPLTERLTDRMSTLFEDVPAPNREAAIFQTGGETIARFRDRVISDDAATVLNYRFSEGLPTPEEAARANVAKDEAWRLDTQRVADEKAAPRPVRPTVDPANPTVDQVAAYKKYQDDLKVWQAAQDAASPARPASQAINQGETLGERWDRYTKALENGQDPLAGSGTPQQMGLGTVAGQKMTTAEAEKEAQRLVINDYIVDQLRDDQKAYARYQEAYTRMTTRTNDRLDPATAQAQAIWEALNPKTHKALRIYDTVLAAIREMALYNVATGIRYIWTQGVGNTMTAVITGNSDILREALNAHNIRAAYREIEGVPDRLLVDSADKLAQDLNISGMRNEAAKIFKDEAAGSLVREGPRETTLYRTLDRLHLGKLTTPFASRRIRDAAGSLDLSFRKALWATRMNEDVWVAARQAQREALDRAASWRGGAIPEDDVTALFKTLGNTFSSDDIRTVGREMGIDNNFSDRLARDWQNTLSTINKTSRDEVDRVFFSGEQTNLDNTMRRVFFFHYWMSRSVPLYTESLLKNPGWLNAYTNMMESADKEAKSGKYGPGAQGFVAMFNSPYGFTMFARPDSLIQILGAFYQESPVDPDGQTAFGKFMDSSGMMFNPLIMSALNYAGVMGDDFAPDPLMLNATTSLATDGINYAKGKGWLSGGPVGNPSTDFNSWLRSKTSGWVPGTSDVAYAKSNQNTLRIINNLVQDVAQERGLDVNSPEVAAAMMDPNSDLYREAFGRYADQLAYDRVAKNVLPTGAVYPKSRVSRADDRNAAIATMPDGAERDALYQERTMANSTDPQATKLYSEQWQYQHVGDPNAEATRNTYNSIRGGSVKEPVTIGGQTFQPYEINGLPEETRTQAADMWASEGTRQTQIQGQNDARTAYREATPDIAEYGKWSGDIRNYDGGPKAFWAEMVASGGNPNAVRWFNGLSPEDKLKDNVLTSTKAFMAFKGIKQSYMEPEPISVRDSSQIPWGPGMDGTGGTGGSDSQGSGKKSDGTITVDVLYKDINDYREQAAAYKQIVEQEFGVGYDPVSLGPQMEQATSQYIKQKYGVSAPSVPRVAALYQEWFYAQPSGSDTSETAFVAWYNDQAKRNVTPGASLPYQGN